MDEGFAIEVEALAAAEKQLDATRPKGDQFKIK